MKKILLYVTFILLLASCHNKKEGDNDQDESQTERSESEKKITRRDYSINGSNAYTDLFIDSMTMENFISTNKLNDTITRRVRSFYNSRNFQYAWFSTNGVTEQGRSFWNLHEYYTTDSNNNFLNNKDLKKRMNALMSDDTLSVSASDKSILNTELTLTQHFIQYMLSNYKPGEIKRKELERFVPAKKEDAMHFADSLLSKKHKDNKYYADVNEAYGLLKNQLQKYLDITKKGGWQTITTTEKTIKKGSTSAVVLAIKRRLEVTGDMPAGDTTSTFDDPLESGVKAFQVSHGLTPTGVVNQSLITEMNVPALKRIEQIIINMGRMQWMLNHTEGNLITVNIPEFVLHVYEGKTKKFAMKVVVGKEGHNTTMFTGNLNQIVFSPYWNVTANIVEKEILPAMRKDANYLSRNKMEQTGETSDGLPVIRQLPGPTNSLGKVKFLFPNSFDIYFHDTPAKELFKRDKRAYSHGCIRLSDPEKMANYLLRNQPEWTAEKINEAMNKGEEQFVKVKDPVPVLITYYTAWVDENGVLNFRDDIYGHDAGQAQKMFTKPL